MLNNINIQRENYKKFIKLVGTNIHCSERGVIWNLLRYSKQEFFEKMIEVNHWCIFEKTIISIESYLNVGTPMVDKLIFTTINLHNDYDVWHPIFYSNILHVSSVLYSFFELSFYFTFKYYLYII